MNASHDSAVIEAMQRYGGSFVHALAACASRADAHNLARLKAAFPEYWAEYTELAGMLKAREGKTA